MCSCLGARVGGGGVEVGILVVLLCDGKGSVKIASSGISCKFSV